MKRIFFTIGLVALLCTSCSTSATRYNPNRDVMEKKYYIAPHYKCDWIIKGDMPLIDIEVLEQDAIEQDYYLPPNYRVIEE